MVNHFETRKRDKKRERERARHYLYLHLNAKYKQLFKRTESPIKVNSSKRKALCADKAPMPTPMLSISVWQQR